MLAGIGNEAVDIRLDGPRTTVHRRDGIALPLRSYAYSHLCAEAEAGSASGTASMHASKVAAEDEDFVRLEL